MNLGYLSTMSDNERKNEERHRRRPWMFVIQVIMGVILAFLFLVVKTSASEEGKCENDTCKNPDIVQNEAPIRNFRMVTHEELSTKNGVDEPPIWISIVGEVYDVTQGPEYYGPGKSYSAFAGRDASVPFCTGKFTAEEAMKGPELLEDKDIPGLLEWIDFYQRHHVYKYVGRLIDPRYFHPNGEPTESMLQFKTRIDSAMIEHEKNLIKMREARAERLKNKKKKKSTTTGGMKKKGRR